MVQACVSDSVDAALAAAGGALCPNAISGTQIAAAVQRIAATLRTNTISPPHFLVCVAAADGVEIW
jgi:hypothetical protein